MERHHGCVCEPGGRNLLRSRRGAGDLPSRTVSGRSWAAPPLRAGRAPARPSEDRRGATNLALAPCRSPRPSASGASARGSGAPQRPRTPILPLATRRVSEREPGEKSRGGTVAQSKGAPLPRKRSLTATSTGPRVATTTPGLSRVARVPARGELEDLQQEHGCHRTVSEDVRAPLTTRRRSSLSARTG